MIRQSSAISDVPMAKEHFFYRETEPLFKKLELLSRRSGVSRGQAFEDWLTAIVCALAAETKEDEYLAVTSRHKKGEKGKRGADVMAEMFAQLVDAMSQTDNDVLGDLYEGSITYGEDGQYFSPMPIAEMMAKLTVDPDREPQDGKSVLINDPLCGAPHNGSYVAHAVMWRSAGLRRRLSRQ